MTKAVICTRKETLKDLVVVLNDIIVQNVICDYTVLS